MRKYDAYTYFDARTNAFSPFAIAGIKGSETVIQPAVQQPQTTMPAVTTAGSAPTESNESETSTGIGILAGILGFALSHGEEGAISQYLIFALLGIIIFFSVWIFVKRRR